MKGKAVLLSSDSYAALHLIMTQIGSELRDAKPAHRATNIGHPAKSVFLLGLVYV